MLQQLVRLYVSVTVFLVLTEPARSSPAAE